MPKLSAWLQQGSPEINVSHLQDDGKIFAALYQLLLIQAFRPNRVIATSAVFVSTVMSSEALSLGSQLLRELKRMDDKNLLMEVQLLESK